MIRTQIQITTAQAESIKRIAVLQNISAAEIIRRAIDSLLSKSSLLAGAAGRKKRALAAVGRFRSGHGSLAEHHDEALAKAYES